MKRIISLFIILTIIFAFVSCTQSTPKNENIQETSNIQPEKTTNPENTQNNINSALQELNKIDIPEDIVETNDTDTEILDLITE